MSTSFDALGIRARLGRAAWSVPQPFGPDGWILTCLSEPGSVIVSAGPCGTDDQDWWHASIAFTDRDPTYLELALLHHAIWPNGWAYQVFAAPADHVNIHEHALHLRGRPDGSPLLPNFGAMGMI